MLEHRLQVKYCKGEKELNDFLVTLHVGTGWDLGYPKLQSISYVSEVRGYGSESEINMGSEVIAAVQYIINIETEE